MKNTASGMAEMTLRGVVLGILITFVFTAANAYLGLKVGLTFNSSIPAAVISMALLSFLRNTTILENNIVQTIASAAGTLSSIIFVLPGLVIVGWWVGFPFWTSFLICVSGGILGVLFTIPLRRALVTNSDLPYPEGVAAAEVLKVGTERASGTKESREGLMALINGALASAGLAIFTATQYAAGGIQHFFRFGTAATGLNFGFSLALMGAGHLVGLSVGMALLIGLAVAWFAAVPILTTLQSIADQPLDAYVTGIWRNQVRFIGAGCIAVAAIWTLMRLAGPMMRGLRATIVASRTRTEAANDARDTDMSRSSIIALAALCFAVVGWLSFDFIKASALTGGMVPLIIVTLLFVLFIGFVIATICGYMAGLIGSSTSPLSGVAILTIVASASLFVLMMPSTPENQQALIAFALFVTAIVIAAAAIANDNLQDLKTGQLVGAAPWRQQVALIIGVIAGAFVIPPVLNLLAQAYGFVGQAVLPSETLAPLPAPQAGLISALAVGVVGGQINWAMISIGGGLGVIAIALDEFMRTRNLMRLPPLAVGMAIYLPMSAVLPVIAGAVIGHWYNNFARRTANPARAEQLGVLVASGLIVGESLFGVVLAGLIVGLGQDTPLALAPADFAFATHFGVAGFAVLILALYGWMVRKGQAA